MKPVCITAAFLLAACCTQPAPPQETHAPEPAFILTPDGIAGIEGRVPFTLPAIERAFEGLDVVAVPTTEMPAFEVREPGSRTALFRVVPDWTLGFAGTVSVLVPGEVGPAELLPGVSSFNDLPVDIARTCKPEPGFRDGPVSCTIALSGGTVILGFPASRQVPLLESVRYIPDTPAP